MPSAVFKIQLAIVTSVVLFTSGRFALKREGRVLLADDMGLGKTVQALAIAAAYRSEWPLLVVTPLSLRCAWREAALRWLGPSPLGISRADIHVVASLNDALDSMQHQQQRKLVTIFTYDLLSRYAEKSGRTVSSFQVVIMVSFVVPEVFLGEGLRVTFVTGAGGAIGLEALMV